MTDVMLHIFTLIKVIKTKRDSISDIFLLMDLRLPLGKNSIDTVDLHTFHYK